jgi:hypothetical protein
MQAAAETIHIKGMVAATIFDMRDRRAQAIERELSQSPPRDTYLQLVSELRRLFAVREYQKANLIVTVGRSVLAQRLANTLTYTGVINYGALGTGTNAAANGDTQLQTEVFRKTTASTSYTTNQAFIDFFYSKADTNGTYQEFGTFIDGSASANSGQLFTRMLTGGWAKTSSESMTVAVQYTIS